MPESARAGATGSDPGTASPQCEPSTGLMHTGMGCWAGHAAPPTPLPIPHAGGCPRPCLPQGNQPRGWAAWGRRRAMPGPARGLRELLPPGIFWASGDPCAMEVTEVTKAMEVGSC